MSQERSGGMYMGLAGLLILAGLGCVGAMLYGEWASQKLLGTAALGLLLMMFAAVVILFRKADAAAGEE